MIHTKRPQTTFASRSTKTRWVVVRRRRFASLVIAATLISPGIGTAQDVQLYRAGDHTSLPGPQPTPTVASPTAGAAATSVTASPAVDPDTAVPAEAIPLMPRSERAEADSPTGFAALSTSASSLAIVLALFGLVVWGMRKYGGRGAAGASGPAMQVLSTMPLGQRQSAALVRCGGRLLLIGLSSQGSRTLAEFTDPDEVADLMANVAGHSDFRGVLTRATPRGKAKTFAHPMESLS